MLNGRLFHINQAFVTEVMDILNKHLYFTHGFPFFDFLPLSLGEIRGFKTRFHLYTVPGQVFYDASRKLILKGADAGDWTPGEVRREDRCGLGHWIEGVSDGPLGKSGAFIDLRDLHARFHETAARIVSLHLDGDTPQARQLMTGNLHKLNNRIQQRLDDMKAV